MQAYKLLQYKNNKHILSYYLKAASKKLSKMLQLFYCTKSSL